MRKTNKILTSTDCNQRRRFYFFDRAHQVPENHTFFNLEAIEQDILNGEPTLKVIEKHNLATSIYERIYQKMLAQ